MATKTKDSKLAWERQKGEGSRAFEAFAMYRDMGPARTTRKVAQELAKSDTIIRRWSAKWNWVNRATQYDDHLDEQLRLENAESLKAAKKRHVSLSQMIQVRVLDRLQALKAEEITVGNLAGMLKTATDIELRALGEKAEDAPPDDGRVRRVEVNWVTPKRREDSRDLTDVPMNTDDADVYGED